MKDIVFFNSDISLFITDVANVVFLTSTFSEMIELELLYVRQIIPLKKKLINCKAKFHVHIIPNSSTWQHRFLFTVPHTIKCFHRGLGFLVCDEVVPVRPRQNKVSHRLCMYKRLSHSRCQPRLTPL